MKHLRKPWRILLKIAIIAAACVVGFLTISYISFQRSMMATIWEARFRLQQISHVYTNMKSCEEYIDTHAILNEVSVEVPSEIKKEISVSETEMGNMQTFILNGDSSDQNIVIFIHGGAYVGQMDTRNWKFCERIAKGAKADIIVPIYPLAPNHTADEAYRDMTAFYRQVRREYAGARITMIGSSAGGGLATGLCESFYGKKISQPDHLILLSPWMDITMTNPAISEYEDKDPKLAVKGLIVMGKIWAGDWKRTDYRLSPIYGSAKRIKSLKNVTIFIGTREIFYPDVTSFANKLEKYGNLEHLHVGEGMFHVWPLESGFREADEADQEIMDVIDENGLSDEAEDYGAWDSWDISGYSEWFLIKETDSYHFRQIFAAWRF